jgi:hypothetical protein
MVAILTAIVGFLASVIGGAVTAGTAVVEAVGSVMTGVWHMINTFISNSPRPLKILIFLFLIVTIGNLFSNFFLGMRYACDSNEQLYESDSIITGIASQIRLNLFSWTIGERDDYIQDNYEATESEPSMTQVGCEGTNVGFFFYNIDLFSYNLWLLIMLLVYGAPMVFGYYSKMGVLH